jgi:DNA-binding MarR family transcriptional regulator
MPEEPSQQRRNQEEGWTMVRNQDANTWSTHQLLSMAARLVERRQDRALAALGLTHAAVIALQCVANGPLNQERLAAQIKVQSQSLGKVLARLESSGMVTRTRSPLDRRSIEVAITEAGRRALEDARRAERNALPPGISRRRTLHEELARVIDFFPDRAGPPPHLRAGRKALVDVPVEPVENEPPSESDMPGTETTGTEMTGTEAESDPEAREEPEAR